MPSNNQAPKNLLLSRPDRMGDVIISTTCLPAIRATIPSTKISLLIQKKYAPLLEDHELIDEVIYFNKDPGQLVKCINRGFDTIVHLEPNEIVEKAACAVGIARRIGFSKKKNLYLTHPFPYRKRLGEKHEAHYAFDLLRYLGVHKPDELNPSLSQSYIYRCNLPERLENTEYIVIHPQAYGNKPRIREDILLNVAKYLYEKYGYIIVIIGATHGDAKTEILLSQLKKNQIPHVDFTGKTDLYQLGGVLTNAKLVFSRDSGPAHLSAALGTTILTFFLIPNDINSSIRWYPLGPKSYIIEKRLKQCWWENNQRFAKRVLKAIPTDYILQTISKILE